MQWVWLKYTEATFILVSGGQIRLSGEKDISCDNKECTDKMKLGVHKSVYKSGAGKKEARQADREGSWMALLIIYTFY